MAGGWANEGAVQQQIDATIDDAIARARQQLPQGQAREHCEECDQIIPEARRRAVQGVRFCLQCQQKQDEQMQVASAYNRRGSKDSQLR